jgi:hypothetical protein
MAAESHQSPRASSREVVVLARRQHEATVGPHSYSVEAQPERGRREAPHANSPRATKSSRRRTLMQVACLPERVQTSSSMAARPLPTSHRVAHRRPLRGPAAAQRCRSSEVAHRSGSLRYAADASSYPGISWLCRAPGATLWRGKRLLPCFYVQRQRNPVQFYFHTSIGASFVSLQSRSTIALIAPILARVVPVNGATNPDSNP